MWRSIEREVCATLNAGSWSCNHIKIFDKYSQVTGVHNFVPTIEKRVNKMCLLMILQDCWAFFLARPSRESSWPLFQVQHQFSAFSKSKMAAVGGCVVVVVEENCLNTEQSISCLSFMKGKRNRKIEPNQRSTWAIFSSTTDPLKNYRWVEFYWIPFAYKISILTHIV